MLRARPRLRENHLASTAWIITTEVPPDAIDVTKPKMMTRNNTLLVWLRRIVLDPGRRG